MKAKENDDGDAHTTIGLQNTHPSQTQTLHMENKTRNSTINMNGSGVFFNPPDNNDGELELCAESTLAPLKPPLRNKWSKIPVRLANSSNNIPHPDTDSNKSNQLASTTLNYSNINGGNKVDESKSNINGINTIGLSLTTESGSQNQEDKEKESKSAELSDGSTTQNKTNTGENGEKHIAEINGNTIGTEEVGTSSGENIDEGNTERTIHLENTNTNTNSNTTTHTHTTTNIGGNTKGIGIENIVELDNIVKGSGSKSTSQSSGASGGHKSERKRGTSGKTNTNSSSSSNSHTSKSTHASSIASSADALAYFSDEVVTVNIMGVKKEHKDGFPLHICAVCDFPIAVYGRLVLLCFFKFYSNPFLSFPFPFPSNFIIHFVISFSSYSLCINNLINSKINQITSLF